MSKSLVSVLNAQDIFETQALAPLVRQLNVSGHNPATSGNYSLRSNTRPECALMSESGIDKSLFTENHFILLQIANAEFCFSEDLKRKPSDETELHLAVYKSTAATCVLHSHLLEILLFADLFPHQDQIELTGLELLKGFKGITSHEQTVSIPVFDNTQDIKALSQIVQKRLNENNKNVFGFILRGHGMYVWGDSVKSAKRHLEVFEYVFKYYIQKNKR